MTADITASAPFAKLATELQAQTGVTVGAGGKSSFCAGALKVNGKIFAMISKMHLPTWRILALEALDFVRK